MQRQQSSCDSALNAIVDMEEEKVNILHVISYLIHRSQNGNYSAHPESFLTVLCNRLVTTGLLVPVLTPNPSRLETPRLALHNLPKAEFGECQVI